MHIATQLALFLENRPGALARVCEALAEDGINILALTTSDTVDHTVVRMVVDNPRTALFRLEERGTLVVESEVLLVETDNRPGSLATLAHALAAKGINIEYLYAATPSAAPSGSLVLRVADPRRALRALQPRRPAKTRQPKARATKR